MKKLFVTLTITTLFACNTTNEMEGQDHSIFDNGIEFSISNSEQGDLLDPANPNHLDTNNIKVFYLIDGKKQQVYMPNLDYPKSFNIFKHEKEYRIVIFLNTTKTADKPITYVQWNDNDTNTIEVTYDRPGNSIIQNKIWLNGELVWERGDNTTAPYVKLTK